MGMESTDVGTDVYGEYFYVGSDGYGEYCYVGWAHIGIL